MARLSDPITILKGVGPSKAKQFASLNIYTLEDLICHFPRGYEDRTKLTTIEKLEVDVPACFKAMVMNTPRTAHIRKGLDITKVQVADHTGRLTLTFFNRKFSAEQLQYGSEYIFYGAVSGDFIGYNMTNPIFESLESQPVTTRRVLPIYPLTAGLNNAVLWKAVQQALGVVIGIVEDDANLRRLCLVEYVVATRRVVGDAAIYANYHNTGNGSGGDIVCDTNFEPDIVKSDAISECSHIDVP